MRLCSRHSKNSAGTADLVALNSSEPVTLEEFANRTFAKNEKAKSVARAHFAPEVVDLDRCILDGRIHPHTESPHS
jgi:hypothetical protein